MKMAREGGILVIFIKRLCVILMVVALAGCGSRSYETHVQIDSQTHPSKDFAGYKTWDFLEYSADLTGLGVLEDADFRLQLANTIEIAMTERGFQRVFESPDLHVGAHAAKEAVTEEDRQALVERAVQRTSDGRRVKKCGKETHETNWIYTSYG
jgi:hypothetical protein